MENENSKYRKFADNIDKALKQFEYSSDWTDLISALGKLGKVCRYNINLVVILHLATILIFSDKIKSLIKTKVLDVRTLTLNER